MKGGQGVVTRYVVICVCGVRLVVSVVVIILMSRSRGDEGLSKGRWASNEGRTRWCDEYMVLGLW